MRIAFIATYPPRQCGIGTFTHNKFIAVMNEEIENDTEGMIITVNDHENTYEYAEEVKFIIRQNQLGDYTEAAEYINKNADICILEHEYGIFGGENGVYILSLLKHLKIPLIAVLHTILKDPSYNQKIILREICRLSAKTVVMTNKAVEFLVKIYNIKLQHIEIIQHGVPDLHFDPQKSKKEFGLESKKVLLTFGLIGRNKGIETVIKALPPVVEKFPEILYIVLGKTHPSVLRHSGEEYRAYIQGMVKEKHLEDNVLFLNEFVDERKLFKYLSATDMYVTPYLSEAQITSGTLSYAVGAGCAVISTPYWHATELLSKGRGRLFDFNDFSQLSSIFLELLNQPAIMTEMQQKARDFGSRITWPKIANKYLHLAGTILRHQIYPPRGKNNFPDQLSLPVFSLAHIRRMTDNTGIIQHAKFNIPNLREGYCLDDNARALLMVLMACKQQKHNAAEELLPVYLGYINYMQHKDGTFRNFLSINGQFLDTAGSEDSFGRTVWALGYLLLNSPNKGYYQTGQEIFFKAVPHCKDLKYIRSIANSIVGMSHYLCLMPGDIEVKKMIKDMAYKLIVQYNIHSSPDWKWFEPTLTYDNAMLPLSLLHAAEVLNDKKIMEIAIESMHFLSGITLKNGYLSVIGNENWFEKNGTCSVFAQQPVDAMAMVLMFQKAYSLTKNKFYLNRVYTCFMWFLGENELCMSMYDETTKGCCDGLESYGINMNQGAESTLAYLISYQALLQVYEEWKTSDQWNIPYKYPEVKSYSYVMAE